MSKEGLKKMFIGFWIWFGGVGMGYIYVCGKREIQLLSKIGTRKNCVEHACSWKKRGRCVFA